MTTAQLQGNGYYGDGQTHTHPHPRPLQQKALQADPGFSKPSPHQGTQAAVLQEWQVEGRPPTCLPSGSSHSGDSKQVSR